MRNAVTVLGIIQGPRPLSRVATMDHALEQDSLESHGIRKAVMRGSEEGRWKSTHLGNSLAAYPTTRRRALEFNVDVICSHLTIPHAPHH
jgi:hypothetical protein